MSEAYESTVRLSFDVRAGLVMRQIHHWAALRVPRRDRGPPVPHLLHRRVPAAARDQLDRRRDAADARDLQGSPATRCPTICCRAPVCASRLDPAPDPVRRHLARVLASSAASSPRASSSPASSSSTSLIPAAIAALLGVHLAILWRQKHTQFPARAAASTTSSARGCGRRTRRRHRLFAHRRRGARRSAASRRSTRSGCTALRPGAVTHRGAARLVPRLDRRRAAHPPPASCKFGDTVSEMFWPAVVFPALTFGLLYPWPFLERRFTHDTPSTTCSTGRVTGRCARDRCRGPDLLLVLLLAGAQDILAQHLDVGLSSVLWTFRILLVVLPVLLGGLKLEAVPRPASRTPFRARSRPRRAAGCVERDQATAPGRPDRARSHRPGVTSGQAVRSRSLGTSAKTGGTPRGRARRPPRRIDRAVHGAFGDQGVGQVAPHDDGADEGEDGADDDGEVDAVDERVLRAAVSTFAPAPAASTRRGARRRSTCARPTLVGRAEAAERTARSRSRSATRRRCRAPRCRARRRARASRRSSPNPRRPAAAAPPT